MHPRNLHLEMQCRTSSYAAPRPLACLPMLPSPIWQHTVGGFSLVFVFCVLFHSFRWPWTVLLDRRLMAAAGMCSNKVTACCILLSANFFTASHKCACNMSNSSMDLQPLAPPGLFIHHMAIHLCTSDSSIHSFFTSLANVSCHMVFHLKIII